MHRLEVVLALECRLDHRGISPDFRLRHATIGSEDADDFPGILTHLEALANVESGKGGGSTDTDDDFVFPGFKAPAFHDLELGAHIKGGGFYAAKRNVRVRAGGALGPVHNDQKLSGGQSGLSMTRYARGVANDAQVFACQS